MMGRIIAVLAAAAAVWCLLPSSTGFVASRAPTGLPGVAQRQQLPGCAPAPSAAAGTSGRWAAAGLAAAALVAGGAALAGRRSPAADAGAAATVVAQRAFASGLVGSEYHGFGKYEWDPAGLAEQWPEHLPWYRESELKHGRICMLAFLGFTVPDAIRIPIAPLDDPSINVINAHSRLIGPGLGEGPMWYLLIFCAIVESFRFRDLGLGFEKLSLENAGDLNFGKQFMPDTEEGKIQIKIKELKNGRLAMLAVSGILTQAVLWKSPHFPFFPVA